MIRVMILRPCYVWLCIYAILNMLYLPPSSLPHARYHSSISDCGGSQVINHLVLRRNRDIDDMVTVLSPSLSN